MIYRVALVHFSCGLPCVCGVISVDVTFVLIKQSYAKPRGRNDGPSAAQKVHRHNRTTLPLDGSLGQVGLVRRGVFSNIVKYTFHLQLMLVSLPLRGSKCSN